MKLLNKMQLSLIKGKYCIFLLQHDLVSLDLKQDKVQEKVTLPQGELFKEYIFSV